MKTRRLIVFILLFCFNISSVFASTPRDVQYHWAGTEINTLIQNGIMNGYQDGRFKPSRCITKEEMCILLASYAKQQGLVTDGALTVDDALIVPGAINKWSSKEVQFMYRNGIANLSEDGYFEPQEILTKENMAHMIFNFYKHFELEKASTAAIQCPFNDISSSYAKDEIIQLYQMGAIKGASGSSYQPKANVTRADVAVLLYNLSGLAPVEPEITLPRYNVIDVPYISQVVPFKAWVGCEGTSLLMGLHAKGYSINVGLKEFLDAMPKTQSNPAKGFVGSPFVPDKQKKTRTTIYPAVLSIWANANYGNVADFSGSSAGEVKAELLAGNPVVIYATMWWNKPEYRIYDIEGKMEFLLSNNHVVLACGYDQDLNRVWISDPYNVKDTSKELKYWIDGATFDRIYNERRRAVVVQ